MNNTTLKLKHNSSEIIDLIYQAHTAGQTGLDESERANVLERWNDKSAETIIEVANRSLSDDLLDSNERSEWIKLGLHAKDLDRYNWQYANALARLASAPTDSTEFREALTVVSEKCFNSDAEAVLLDRFDPSIAAFFVAAILDSNNTQVRSFEFLAKAWSTLTAESKPAISEKFTPEFLQTLKSLCGEQSECGAAALELTDAFFEDVLVNGNGHAAELLKQSVTATELLTKISKIGNGTSAKPALTLADELLSENLNSGAVLDESVWKQLETLLLSGNDDIVTFAVQKYMALDAERLVQTANQATRATSREIIVKALRLKFPDRFPSPKTLQPGPIMRFQQIATERLATDLGDFHLTTLMTGLKSHGTPHVITDNAGRTHIYVASGTDVYRFLITATEITKQKIAHLGDKIEISSVLLDEEGFAHIAVTHGGDATQLDETSSEWIAFTKTSKKSCSEKVHIEASGTFETSTNIYGERIAAKTTLSRTADYDVPYSCRIDHEPELVTPNESLYFIPSHLSDSLVVNQYVLKARHGEIEFDYNEYNGMYDLRYSNTETHLKGYLEMKARSVLEKDIAQEFALRKDSLLADNVKPPSLVYSTKNAFGQTEILPFDNVTGDVSLMQSSSDATGNHAIAYLDSKADDKAPGIVVAFKTESGWQKETVINSEWLSELNGDVEDLSLTMKDGSVTVTVRAKNNQVIEVKGRLGAWESPANVIYTASHVEPESVSRADPMAPSFVYPESNGFLKLARQENDGVWRSYALDKHDSYSKEEHVKLDHAYLPDGRVIVIETVRELSGDISLKILAQAQ